MAKKKSQKSIHTHVPTHIGLGIIALVALVVGLVVVTQYNTNNQTQTVDSHASTAKTPIVKPIAPATSVNTTKKCISYNTSGKCVLYQSTTTVVNTKTPCLSYNTSGQCTYYQGTTQTTKTWAPTPFPMKKTCTPTKTCLRFNNSGACLVANVICK